MLAAGLIAAIFTVLAMSNDHYLDDWTFILNLTTVAALMATSLRATLATVVVAVMSQSKWLWFTDKRPRPLHHLDLFAKASTSTWSAASLVPIVLGRSFIASVCIILTLASLAIGPMVQQGIRTVPCERELSEETAIAEIFLAHELNWTETMGMPSPFVVPIGRHDYIDPFVMAMAVGA